MKNTLKIDFEKKQIIMDRTFKMNAENTNSEEYAHLQQVRKENPTYTLITRQIKKNPMELPLMLREEAKTQFLRSEPLQTLLKFTVSQSWALMAEQIFRKCGTSTTTFLMMMNSWQCLTK